MSDVEIRRKVPVAVLALICVSIIGILQILLLTGAYQVDAGTVRKFAPFLYNPFRKVVGEHPSTRPQTAETQAVTSRETEIETVTGIKPEELSIKIEAPAVELPEDLPAAEPVIIPAGEPAAPDPLNSDEPVG